MIEANAARLIGSPKPSGVKSYAQVSGNIMVLTLLTLVLLDILSPPGPPLNSAIGAFSYGGKTAIGVIVTLFGFLALFSTRLPLIFRISVICYTTIVATWFLIWVFGSRNVHAANSSAVTYLLNPTYSVWSWLFILVIPLMARLNYNGVVSKSIARIPLSLGFVLMLVPVLVMSVLNVRLNASNAGVFMLFLLACRPCRTRAERVIHFLLAIVVCGAMLLADYRIYAIAALLYAINLYIPKSRKLLVTQMIFIAVIPVIFHYLIQNYANYFISKDNPLLFDTRSFLFTELVDDFSSGELWTGRGIDASYFSPYFLYVAKHMGTTVGYNNIWRTSSEIGWLNIILHYGIQGLAPFYIAVVAPAFRRHKNLDHIVPMDGIYCFLPVMMLLFAGELWNAISTSYFCWFISLGLLLTAAPRSKGLRA